MKNLLKFSLIISLSGVWLLLILPDLSSPEFLLCDDVKNIPPGGRAFTSGVVSSYKRLSNDFFSFRIKSFSCELEAVCNGCVNVPLGDEVFVLGTVSLYNNKTQIHADLIKEQIKK